VFSTLLGHLIFVQAIPQYLNPFSLLQTYLAMGRFVHLINGVTQRTQQVFFFSFEKHMTTREVGYLIVVAEAVASSPHAPVLDKYQARTF
jgi:hypothetical protein